MKQRTLLEGEDNLDEIFRVASKFAFNFVSGETGEWRAVVILVCQTIKLDFH